MRLLFLTTNLSFISSLARASSQIGVSNKGEIINLSYQTHLDSSKITSLLLTKIQSASEIESRSRSNFLVGPKELNIDVSASHLGDEGMVSLFDSLLECQDGKAPSSTIEVSLEARMNRLSPTGASNFLERIMTLNGDLNSANATENEKEVQSFDEKEEEDASATDETSPTSNSTSTAAPVNTQVQNTIYIHALDLGLNDIGIGHDGGNTKKASKMHKSLRKLIENESECCPRILRMDACGLGAPSCRAIGKGLINRQNHVIREPTRTLRKLYLSGNAGIGDGGVAALAAALKSISESSHEQEVDAILDELDISACGVGDAGIGALAMAIESNPRCVKKLDLSNNDISDEGVIAFSKSLITGYQKSKMYCIDSLDLSNNVDIGDEGAEALFDALECGAIRSISLRSCSVRWRGVAALGNTLSNMFASDRMDDMPRTIEVDLSGNHIGKKEKKKKKASVHTNMMNSMSFIGKRLKTGLKDVGLGSMVGSGSESDDEVEMMDSMRSEFADEEASSRCGAAEMYDSLNQDIDTSGATDISKAKDNVMLGMRMCNFDERGIDALGASCVLLGDHVNVRLCVDCEMNKEACDEEEVTDALLSGDFENVSLREVAERHVEAMDRYNDFDEDYSDDFGEDSYDEDY